MKRFLLMVVVLSVFVSVGCTRTIRYTEQEIGKFPPEIQENIRKGQINLGMEPGQVRYAWGSPDSITFLEAYDGKNREEWIYSQEGTFGVVGTKILLFYDGRLIYIR
jgi:uncharacterized protein YneF (UPF0154 family)